MDSILNSVKAYLGITSDYTAFDSELIMSINSAFFVLWQLGVGNDTSEPFRITSANDTWDEFVDAGQIDVCRSDIALRVRLMFDPPTNSFLVEAIKDQIKEYEVRMTYAIDDYNDYYES